MPVITTRFPASESFGGSRLHGTEVQAELHKTVYQLAIVFEVEVFDDGTGYYFPNAIYFRQDFHGNAFQKIPAAELLCDETCCYHADVPDAEGVEDAGEGLLFALLYCPDQVLRALLAEAF